MIQKIFINLIYHFKRYKIKRTKTLIICYYISYVLHLVMRDFYKILNYTHNRNQLNERQF